MMILVVGGSGSGKSAYAEGCISRIAEGRQKYYIATMRVFDDETRVKVEKHRRSRNGKGFITIEQPVSVGSALKKIKGGAALIECISNLTANEMFGDETPQSYEAVAEKIISDIKKLDSELEALVVVTNNVFEDGIIYDKATMEYMKALGNINRKLAAMADKVVETAMGNPVVIKEMN